MSLSVCPECRVDGNELRRRVIFHSARVGGCQEDKYLVYVRLRELEGWAGEKGM